MSTNLPVHNGLMNLLSSTEARNVVLMVKLDQFLELPNFASPTDPNCKLRCWCYQLDNHLRQTIRPPLLPIYKPRDVPCSPPAGLSLKTLAKEFYRETRTVRTEIFPVQYGSHLNLLSRLHLHPSASPHSHVR